MRVSRGVVALLGIALLVSGGGCSDSTQEQAGATPQSTVSVDDTAPGGIETVDWPDGAEGATALLAELPAELEGSLQLEVTDLSDRESQNGLESYSAIYRDPDEEFDASSQFVMVVFGDSDLSYLDDATGSRPAELAGVVMSAAGVGGCVGLRHSPVFADFCDPAMTAEPTGDVPTFITVLEGLRATPDPGGLLYIEFIGGPIDEDGNIAQLHGITWSDSRWSYIVTATSPGLRAGVVAALVSSARQA